MDAFYQYEYHYKGGIERGMRKSIWPYLLGYHQFRSSASEREIVIKERRIEYAALKARWKDVYVIGVSSWGFVCGGLGVGPAIRKGPKAMREKEV